MSNNTPSATTVLSFLGPLGTFTDQALLTQKDLSICDLNPLPSIPEVLHRVSDGRSDFGFVAIENSIEGSVNITQDTLTFETDVLIQREVVISVQMNLLVNSNVGLENIEEVISFPHATAQCRQWLEENLPNAVNRAANSTAEAAQQLADSGASNIATIGSARAAEVYGLTILAEDIEDHPENQTRFVLVAKEGIPAPTGHDKTSLIIFQRADRPGSLLGILQEFAARTINLTRLESRPTKQALGDYCFLIDIEGHIADELVADCLRVLQTKHGQVKFLGSYPTDSGSSDDQDKNIRNAVSAASQEADDWLTDLRNQLPK